MRNTLLTATLALLVAGAARGQSPPPGLASRWGWGVRVGLGQGSGQHGDSRHEYDFAYPSATGGFLATRYFAGPRLSLGLEALAGRQTVEVSYQQAPSYPAYAQQTLHQWRLFVPFYLRTGTPVSRLHLLVGTGPTLRLGILNADAAYYARPVELTLLLGAEVRLAPFHRCETTLGLRAHLPITPSYAYGYPTAYATPQGAYIVSEGRKDVRASWVGFTLGTTLYPAAAK